MCWCVGQCVFSWYVLANISRSTWIEHCYICLHAWSLANCYMAMLTFNKLRSLGVMRRHSSFLRRSLQASCSVARRHCTHAPGLSSLKVLFAWLPRTRPTHGPCLRWKDLVKDDLRKLRVRNWFGLSQDRKTSYFTSIKHHICVVYAIGVLRSTPVWLSTNALQLASFLFMNNLVHDNAQYARDGLRVQEV